MDGNFNSISEIYVIKMADDADQSTSATNEAVSGADIIPAIKNKSHQGTLSKKDKLYRYIVLMNYVASSIIN